MNGTDPSPQNTALQDSLFTQHKVKVFLYNQQVTDSLTGSFIKLAEENNIPVVGVYETMPTPGTTTSRGCSPRSMPSRRPSPTRSRPSTCNDRRTRPSAAGTAPSWTASASSSSGRQILRDVSFARPAAAAAAG